MLQFDTQALVRDILKECERALKIVAEKAKQAMIYELSSHAGAGSGTTGRSEWNREVGAAIDFIAANTATEAVVKVGLVNSQDDYNLMFKALLLDLGSGTKADIEGNPWIAEYLVSDAYNTNRSGFEILSRPGQKIYDLETDEWRMSKAQSEYEIPQFSQPPTYFFENGLRLIIADFNKAIDDVTNNFNFAKYLKSTVK
ncbi:MAG: hypothetical protein WC389_21820 [Lutibacter sp.]|jgi:hypothetical protein